MVNCYGGILKINLTINVLSIHGVTYGKCLFNHWSKEKVTTYIINRGFSKSNILKGINAPFSEITFFFYQNTTLLHVLNTRARQPTISRAVRPPAADCYNMKRVVWLRLKVLYILLKWL